MDIASLHRTRDFLSYLKLFDQCLNGVVVREFLMRLLTSQVKSI